MENNNPIKEYDSKQKKKTEFLGIEENTDNITENEYYTGDKNSEYFEVIGEETEYEQRILKKKKRKKKMLTFMQALMGKYNQNPEYEGTKINKIHFVEKLNVGKESLRKICCHSYCICC